MTRLFVTSTGTEIGKTHVTAALAHLARRRGLSLRVVKPLVSGFDPAAPEGSDPAVLATAAGLTLDAATLANLSPWRYRAPLSPDMAAAREGKAIDFAALTEFCRAALAGPEECVLIEGVGGVMVPLDDSRTVRDWIAALELPAVLVAGSYLGTLSHTLTACLALAAAGIPLRAIVISESAAAPVPLAETMRRSRASLRIHRSSGCRAGWGRKVGARRRS
ncbi:MAG: dethiobiotin synthase [Aliidongia sp.]